MPELDPVQWASIEARLAVHDRIHKSFEGKRWVPVSCYLCGWYSNGRTFDEARAVDKAHIATEHATELAEMNASYIPPSELRDSWHDHECNFQDCMCRCGCRQSAGCTVGFGPLCATCMVREGRGDSAHGEKEAI